MLACALLVYAFVTAVGASALRHLTSILMLDRDLGTSCSRHDPILCYTTNRISRATAFIGSRHSSRLLNPGKQVCLLLCLLPFLKSLLFFPQLQILAEVHEELVSKARLFMLRHVALRVHHVELHPAL